MVYRVMPLLDLVSAVVILFSGILPGNVLFYIAGYLLIKGGLFFLISRDFASSIDIVIGVYVLLIVIGFSHMIANTLASLFLAQKGLLGMIAL